MNKIIKKISAGGILFHDGKILLIHWKSKDLWELPKGTIEDGESPEKACIREVKEETGYQTKIIGKITTSQFQFKWDDGNTYDQTIHYYLLNLNNERKFKHKRESHEDFMNRWVSLDKAKDKLSFDSMKEVVTEAEAVLKELNLI